MLRTDKILTAMVGGVGFRDSDLTNYNIVDATNQLSSSGLFYQDASELVSIKNIKDCQENPSITTLAFNSLLTNMQKSVILDVCNKVIEGKSDFISSYNLYPFEKTFSETISSNSKFVCIRIEPMKIGYALRIPYIELSFDAVDTFNMYLYNSNKPTTPIQTKSVTTVAGESTVIDLGYIIADDSTYKGGVFYLGYFQDDLTASPYYRNFESSNVKIYNQYFRVEPVSLSYSETTIDVSSVNYEADTFGMNLGIDIYNDYTELLIRNKNLLWQSFQFQMHEKVLTLIKYSQRSNSTEIRGKDMIDKVDFELYGSNKLGIDGVISKLNRSVDHVKKALFYQPKISVATLS